MMPELSPGQYIHTLDAAAENLPLPSPSAGIALKSEMTETYWGINGNETVDSEPRSYPGSPDEP